MGFFNDNVQFFSYILQVVLQPLEWNENLKDIQDKWDYIEPLEETLFTIRLNLQEP